MSALLPGAAIQPAGASGVAALQAALAAEHAAIYGYGVAGARLAGARQAQALRDWDAHQSARDTLVSMLAARGTKPVMSATAYQLPFQVRGASTAVALLALLEDGVTRAYLGVVAVTDPAVRSFGARSANAAALRAATWRGRTTAFPGLALR